MSYYWVYGTSEKGKRIFDGPYRSEVEAQFSADKLADPVVVPLRTRSRTEAVRRMRNALRKSGKSFDDILGRMFRYKTQTKEVDTPARLDDSFDEEEEIEGA